MAEALGRLRRLGHTWNDIAIIYRTKSIARHFETALRRVSVPYRVVGGRKFYERREVRDLLAYLRVLVNPADDAALLRIVNVPPRGIGAKTQSKLREMGANLGQPLLRAARSMPAGKSVGQKGLAAFVTLMDELSMLARDVGLGALVSEVVRRSGYLEMLEGDVDKEGRTTKDASGRIENLEALIDDAARFEASLKERTGALDQLTAWLDRISLTMDSDDVPNEAGEVTLMTVHASKGLEYPVVFVVQMNEGVFPHERSMETGLEEERRLAYVAFTRAMKRLIVTRSLRQPSHGGRTGKLAEASRFLYGIPLEVVDGDLPSGEPASGGRADRMEASRTATSRLGTFLEHRRARAQPDETMTLIEIESAEQLRPGVRVHHPRYGVGEIRQVGRSAIFVSFGGRQQRIAAPASGLRIVAEP